MFKEEMNKELRGTHVVYIQLIKLATFFFAFWVASYVPAQMLIDYRWIWLVLFIVFALPVFFRFWINHRSKCNIKKNDKKK